MQVMSMMNSKNVYDDELMTALNEQNITNVDVLEDLFRVPDGREES